VAVCAAGLLAGPLVGVALSVFVTWLAVKYDGLPLESIGVSMLCGGLAGGWLYRWRPKLAQHPLTGFFLTLAVSLLGNALIFFYAADTYRRCECLGGLGWLLCCKVRVRRWFWLS
jgi:LytS/YehU family sensor histidine kinase